MTYGYEIRRADQSITSDSTHLGGVLIELLTITTNAGSKTYPQVIGNSMYFMVLRGGRHGLLATANESGQGVLSWEAGNNAGSDTIVAVFAKDILHPYDYGIAVYGDDGALAISWQHGVPQFLGTVQPPAEALETVDIPNGQRMHTHVINTPAYGDAGMLVVTMCTLPDSGAANTWYAWTPWLYGVGASIAVFVVADPGVSYPVPTLHLYSVNRPPEPGDLYGLEVLSASGERVYVSSERNLAAVGDFALDFPAQGETVTHTLALPEKAGIIMPEYSITDTVVGPYVHSYRGMVKRVENQLTFNTMLTAERVDIAGEPPVKLVAGTRFGNRSSIVDMARYGAGSVGGSGGEPQQAPVFTTHPADTTVAVGGSYSFTAVAVGPPAPTYQWYRDNVAISGATGTTYSGTAASGDNGAVFKCLATNSVSAVFSSPATLSISAGFVAVSITGNPSSGSVASGGSITFSMAASGTAPISYQWYDAGVSGTTYTPISGATGTTYSPAATTGNNGKRYFCRASNTSSGTTYTADTTMATLTVTSSGSTDAYIVSHPGSYTRASGGSATFSVTAGGTGPFTYQWYSSTTGLISGATGSSLTRTVSSTQTGYRCFVTGATGVGVFSNYGYLTLGVPPTITQQPTPKTVSRNGTAVFSVAATNYTSIEWYRDDVADSPPVYVGSGTSHTADTSVVGLFEYHCVVIGTYGTVTSNYVMLTVNEPAQAPVITQQPVSKTTTVGVAVYFDVVASPATGYQWFRNNVAFGGNSATCAPLVGSTSETGTQYKCQVFNNSLSTMSSTVTITVNEVPNKPVISVQPTGGNVAIGGTKLLRCVASPVTAYKWYRDGTLVGTGQDYYVDTSVSSSYSYWCMCENTVGGVTETQKSNTVVVNVGPIN